MNKKICYFLIVISVVAFMFVLSACGGNDAGDETDSEEVTMDNLIGVRYNRQSGMVWGEDFYADIRQNEIIHTRFYPETDERSDYVVADNVPITEEQWQELEAGIKEILPLLKKVEKTEPGFFDKILDKAVQPTDGPDYNDFYLIWDDEVVVQYYTLGDDRFYKILKLMEEIVRTNAPEYAIEDV